MSQYTYGYEEYYDDQSSSYDPSNDPSALDRSSGTTRSSYTRSSYTRSTYARSARSNQSEAYYNEADYGEERYHDDAEQSYSQTSQQYADEYSTSRYEEGSAFSYESQYDQSQYDQSQYDQSVADPYAEYNEYFANQGVDDDEYDDDYYEEEGDDEYDDYDEYFEEENQDPPLESFQFDDGNTATREVNVSKLELSLMADDELPISYKDAMQYGQYLNLPKRHEETKVVPPKRRKIRPIRMLPPSKSMEYRYPFTKRRYYTLSTIVAAAALASTGIYLSTQSLSTLSSQQFKSSYINKDAEYLFMPKFHFGGVSGGIKGDIQRRANIDEAAMDAIYHEVALPGMVAILRNSNSKNDVTLSTSTSLKTQDPYHGFGPPQFNPAQSARSISVDGHTSNKVTLTSTPLTMYNPPSSGSGPAIVLDPLFHGSMIDVSHLPYNPVREIPVFWDVPMTGGPRVQYVFGHCLKLVQCSEAGKEILSRQNEVHGESSSLEYNPPLKVEFIHSSTYANVDCSTSTGIDRAISQDLATSNMVDVIYSPNIMDVARLFLPPVEAYGRGIVLIRDPVDRILALYEYLNVAKHGDSNGVNKMSLEQFVRSGLTEDNPLTRSLSSNKSSELRKADLQVAKEILKRKFIIGLYDQLQNSIERFEKFFGWQITDEARSCQSNELKRESSAHYNKYSNRKHPGLTPGALDVIKSKSGYDLELFQYAKFMFKHQGLALFDIRDG